jgi:hypothetical protein
MSRKHTISPGDSIVRLSELYGHFSLTIWNDPANAGLRSQRSNMNVLMPGDVVTIPDLRPGEVQIRTGQRHVFLRKGIPPLLRIQLLDNGHPRALQEYVLTVDGQEFRGTTNDQGLIEQFVSAQAAGGELVIGPDKRTVQFQLGHMDPVSEWSGVQKRLQNLGYLAAPAENAQEAKAQAALRAFQQDQGLEPTGRLDGETRYRLEAVHDEPG